ncbi:hypothetical protein LCGC14_2552280 [marine sediment metagenome]|uniref:Uncharacterized protein n=1 Tax=marine sediment metagenome TaxID=412755 RepID=A0A0F9AN50_9ZZZZ
MKYADFEVLPYGFKYGAAEVVRIASDGKKGWVVIGLDTPKTHVQLYVTKTGKVRISVEGKEVSLSD